MPSKKEIDFWVEAYKLKYNYEKKILKLKKKFNIN